MSEEDFIQVRLQRDTHQKVCDFLERNFRKKKGISIYFGFDLLVDEGIKSYEEQQRKKQGRGIRTMENSRELENGISPQK